MDQRTFDRKVTELAEKLKKSGVATSDSMAQQLATDIIRTEESTRASKNTNEDTTKQQPESNDTPRNLVVEEAIKNAQGAAHNARVDEDVDQEKSISELLDEDAQKPQQPKVTLDTPVVEGGVAREEKETPSAFIQSTPRPKQQPVSDDQVSSTDQSEVVVETADSESSVEQDVSSQAPNQQEVQKQEEPPLQDTAHSSSQDSSETKNDSSQETSDSEKKKEFKPEEKVDLSEMFNFSKKK